MSSEWIEQVLAQGIFGGFADLPSERLPRLRRFGETWRAIPLLTRGTILTLIFFAPVFVLPPMLYRSAYLGVERLVPCGPESSRLCVQTVADPTSLVFISLIVSTFLLTSASTFATLMWLPNASRTITGRLAPRRRTDLRIHRWWHLPGAILIVGAGILPYSLGLADDAVFEWWEAIGALGWIFGVGPVVANIVVIVVCIFQLLHLVKWLLANIPDILDVKPLAPDGSGGLRELGNVIVGLAAYALAMGLWMALQNGVWLPIWNNQGRPWNEFSGGLIVNGVLVLVAYSTLVYILVIMPSWRIRQVMLRQRDSELQRISKQFESTSKGTHVDPLTRLPVLRALREEHDLVREIYPTFPFTVPRLRLLTAVTISPPILGVASLAVQFWNEL